MSRKSEYYKKLGNVKCFLNNQEWGAQYKIYSAKSTEYQDLADDYLLHGGYCVVVYGKSGILSVYDAYYEFQDFPKSDDDIIIRKYGPNSKQRNYRTPKQLALKKSNEEKRKNKGNSLGNN